MEVLVSLGEVPLLKRSRFLGIFIKPLLDALVVVNRLYLRIITCLRSIMRVSGTCRSRRMENLKNLPQFLWFSRAAGATATISDRGAWRSFKRPERRQKSGSLGAVWVNAGPTTCS